MAGNTKEITINPLDPNLSSEDKNRLYLLFTKNQKRDQFFQNQCFIITNNEEEERISLGVDVIKRQSKKDGHICRYQILGKEFAEGGFGKVREAPAVIKLDTERKTVGIVKKERIVKHENWSANEKLKEISDAEYAGTQEVHGGSGDGKHGVTRTTVGFSSYLFMHRFPGEDLGKFLVGVSGSLKPKLTYGEQLVIALECLYEVQRVHDKDLVHFDIKPKNFVFDQKTGSIKIIDFGLSMKAGKKDVGIRGTEGYIALEVLKNANNSYSANKAADIYSLSMVLSDIFNTKLTVDGKTHIWASDYAAALFLKRTELSEAIPLFEEHFESVIKADFDTHLGKILDILANAHTQSPKNNILWQMRIDLSNARKEVLDALAAKDKGEKTTHDVLQKYDESYAKVKNILTNQANLAALDARSKGVIGKLFTLISAPIRFIFSRKSSDLLKPREEIAKELGSMGKLGGQPVNPEPEESSCVPR